jgi:hypothetical protein
MIADRIYTAKYQVVAGRIQTCSLDVEHSCVQAGKINVIFHGVILPYRNKKQNKPQGSGLFCSKGVLGLEINVVIRGIATLK